MRRDWKGKRKINKNVKLCSRHGTPTAKTSPSPYSKNV